MVQEGWPEERTKVPVEIRPYWNYRDEISVIDKLVMKGNKIIIPRKLRSKMINYVHESHLGIVKCKALARESMFWPSMNSQIEDKIAKCDICAKHQSQNPKEPMIKMGIPDRPYSKISVDIFEMRGRQYLLSVDYFSKWPEVSRLDNMTSRNVIAYLKSHISKYGIPDEIISDNARQFTSQEFRQFARDYGFQHITSSPYHYQSHGQVERTVRTVKNLLKKAEDPYLAILNYRNTPIDGIGLSPAQMLMGRRLRTKLPVMKKLLNTEKSSEIKEKLQLKQDNCKKQYDKHAGKQLKPLKPGQFVMFRHKDSWQNGTIQQSHDMPRSYVVKSPEGKYYRRNRRHINPTKVPPVSVTPDDQVILPSSRMDKPIQQEQGSSQQKQKLGLQSQHTEKTKQYITRSGRIVKPPDRLQY
jgi:transposase InsO family protein